MQDVGSFTNQFSLAIWHKWSSEDGGPTTYDAVCNCNASWSVLGAGWSLYWYGSDTIHFYVNAYTGNYARATGLTATAWNFFVAVYDGTLGSDNIKVYANGVVGGITDSYTSNLSGQTNLVEVGKTANLMGGAGADDYTVGHCDEFAIWDTALSADEVTTLYNEGSSGFFYNVNSGLYTSAGNLRLWWRLGDDGDSDGADGIQDKSGNGNHGTLTDITSANFEEEVA